MKLSQKALVRVVEQVIPITTGATKFSIGQKVRVWYSSTRTWKVATIRAVCLHWATRTHTYGLECDGRINTHWYRADQLQLVRSGQARKTPTEKPNPKRRKKG